MHSLHIFHNYQITVKFYCLLLLFYIFFFRWDWGLNTGFCAFVNQMLYHLSIFNLFLPWLFWRWGSLQLFAQAGLELWFSQTQCTIYLGLKVWATVTWVPLSILFWRKFHSTNCVIYTTNISMDIYKEQRLLNHSSPI
jgi:hypothetical protein